MPVSEVRRMSKIKRGILFIVILAVFLVISSVGMEYYVVHQLNGEVTGRNRPFAALTVGLQLMIVDREHREFQRLITC